ncbi:DNA polymerase IV [Francisella tularensis subsp. holarctica FSC022]|uniref:DNA polymerase IV n=1 Tax=Francisella tularensis TaxID=263 RepID=UPI00015D79EF|nr:DNA polymerase IV [Francisella tularensis]EDO66395.1 DNA polymerase IV [Francisella tularensis subsp. holarctica FSC022]OPH23452.1 DNA polymerase IV [Francisella tularensis subsp. holarctica FSC022]
MTKLRKIIHIDMDYFFTQVEEKANPSLKDKPFAVGGTNPKRGVISTCNYIAREYGVRSAMPTAIAMQKCPNLILLNTDFAKYKAASAVIRDIFYSFTDKVEPLSLDEAYLDVTDVKEYKNSATLIAQAIKQEIFNKTGLTGSAGVAPNKLLAKIASDINKPNGLYVVTPKQVDSFVKDLPVKKLFGVGKVSQEKLKSMGVETCLDLQQLSLATLVDKFGKFGSSLYNYARGIDNREVNPVRIRKSISVENTYLEDLKTLGACLEKLPSLYDKLTSRMTEEHYKSIIGIVVKFTDTKFNKTSLTRVAKILDKEMLKNLIIELHQKRNHPIRLIGIGVKLGEIDDKQMDLF